MPHTYLLDTRVWRAQDPEHGPQPGDLGLPLPVTGFTEVQWRRPPLGEGRLAPSHLLGTHGAPHGAPHPSSPPHEAVTVLNPTFQMERQRLARDLSQATWQWMKDSDSGHSGPQRVTGTLELRHTQHERQDSRKWASQACFLLVRQGGCLK